jgi:hypothetical protein
VDGVIVDASEHVGQPGLGIDVVELGGLDQRPGRTCAPAEPVRWTESTGHAPGLEAVRTP